MEDNLSMDQGRGRFGNDSSPFAFIVHFFPIIIIPALLQVTRR